MSKKELLADGLLLLTALIWGSAFAVVKNTLDAFPPAAMIAMRFAVAAVITGILFRRHLKGLTLGDLGRGGLVGLLLALAYLTQTIALQSTTAGKNAFLTAIYVMLVPFGCFALFREKLRWTNWVSAALMLLGVGVLSLSGEEGGLNAGDGLTMVCGVLFAAHMIAVDRCQRRTDPYAIIVMQFAVTAVVALMWTLTLEGGQPLVFTPASIGGLAYLAIFSTTIGMSLQNIGQSMAPPTHASLLLSLESVFGVLSGVVLLGETLTPRMMVGFGVIFMALLVSEWKPQDETRK